MAESSLDILDDCLKRIYEMRKSALHSRSKFRLAKKSRERRPSSSSSNYYAITGSKSTLKNITDITTNSDTVLEPPVGTKDQLKLKSDSNVVVVGDKKADSIACGAFSSLLKEIKLWEENNPGRLDDDDFRESFSDYLNDKYMCQILDPLPPSKFVTLVRRQVTKVIDELASKGQLPNFSATLSPPGESDEYIGVDTNASKINAVKSQKKSNSRRIETISGDFNIFPESSSDNRDAHFEYEINQSQPHVTLDRQSKVVVDGDSKAKADQVKEKRILSSTSLFKKPIEVVSQSPPPDGGGTLAAAEKSKLQPTKEEVPLTNNRGRITNNLARTDASVSRSGPDAAVDKRDGEEAAIKKKEAEKLKIKQQYESYMRLRSKVESAPDTKEAKEYEENLDEIRSLITSIKGKPPT